ncbi:hypothetical protein [Aromatoleum sp.]|uniref:hypothetical protein n=1 Tax=Aromatoleum sp. TaxID=2307007 RepID=UPI002FCAD5AC
MIILQKNHIVGLVALAVTGAGLSVPALRVFEHAQGADDVVEGFFPALCEGDMPPAELLALANWPLDAKGIGCRPHPGVFDAVAATSTAGERPGAISRVLAEYVLSLEPVPDANAAKSALAGAGTAGETAVGRTRTFPAPLTPDRAAVAKVFAVPNLEPEVLGSGENAGSRLPDLQRTLPVDPTRVAPEPFAGLPLTAPAGAGTGVELPMFAGQLVADDTLGELRGGFETPGGLALSFGIERLVYVNGELSSTTTLNVADLGQLVGGAAGVQPLPVGTSIAVIQNGPNNTFDAGALASGAFATVIQNSLDNQKIQTVTTINAQVNSLQMLQASRFGESLRNAVNSSLLR